MLKKTLDYIINVIQAPHREVSMPQGLTWEEVGLTFVIISFVVYFFNGLATGPAGFLMVFPFAVVGTIFNGILCLVILGLVMLALKVMNFTVNFKDLTETFLTALVPAYLLFIAFTFFNVFIGSLDLAFFIGLITSVLTGFLFFLGLKGRFAIPQNKAAIVAIVVILILIIPGFYQNR